MPITLKAKGLTPPKSATPARAVKLVDEGIVVAIVAVTGVVDAVNDLIVPGAFTASLAVRRPKVVDDHEWQRKVGRTLHTEEWLPGDPRLPKKTKEGRPWPAAAGALVATMQYNLGHQRGRDSFADVKFYAETNEAEFSIGYKVPDAKARLRSDGVRVILAVNLFEFSHVLFGAAPLSMALSVKSIDGQPNRLSEKDLAHIADFPARHAKNMHAGSAGTATVPASLTPDDDDENDFPTDAPAVATDAPWDDDTETKTRAGLQAKTAADVLLEVKTAFPTTPVDQEVKAMSRMKGSYQERTNLIEVAARELFDATHANPCVCVVATFEAEAIVTVYGNEGEGRSYVLPYTLTAAGVELGQPSPVELSLVAEPEAGTLPVPESAVLDEPASVEEITVIAPLMASLTQAQLIAGTEGKAGAAMRTVLGDLFGKGAPFEGAAAPFGADDDMDAKAHEAGCDCELCDPAGDMRGKAHEAGCSCELCAPSGDMRRKGHPAGCMCTGCTEGKAAAGHKPGCACVGCAVGKAASGHKPGCACVGCSAGKACTSDDPMRQKGAPEEPEGTVTLDPDEHFDTLADLEDPESPVDPSDDSDDDEDSL